VCSSDLNSSKVSHKVRSMAVMSMYTPFLP
jgi:hypothetical protein